MNPKPQAQHDVFNVLVLDKCYIQSRVDFLLTPHGKSERVRAVVNKMFNHKMKKTKHTLVRVAPLYTSKWTGITTFSHITISTIPPRYSMTRGYVSHMVLESLQWAYKGPACQSDFEANYRSSLRESRWGIQPHGKSIHHISGQWLTPVLLAIYDTFRAEHIIIPPSFLPAALKCSRHTPCPSILTATLEYDKPVTASPQSIRFLIDSALREIMAE
jgi:hypothetical protein